MIVGITERVKMNKTLKLLLAGLICFTQSVIAQSAFQGFYGQIATGYENNAVGRQDYQKDGYAAYTNQANVASAPLIVGLGYNFSIAPEYLLGIGVDYSTLSTTFSGASAPCPGCLSNANGTQNQYKVSNRYSIYVTPGYAFDSNKLGYLKIGYANQTISETISAGPIAGNVGSSYGSGSVGGYVVGLGYKQAIGGAGLYAFGEANYYGFSNGTLNNRLNVGTVITNNNPTSSAYNFLLGLGYKF